MLQRLAKFYSPEEHSTVHGRVCQCSDDLHETQKLTNTGIDIGTENFGVLCITSGSTWGSSFAVIPLLLLIKDASFRQISEDGYVLTNRHVFSDYLDPKSKTLLKAIQDTLADK